MYKGNIHAPKHAKLIYENATAPVFSLISNGGFLWNLNISVFDAKAFNNKSFSGQIYTYNFYFYLSL